MAPPLNNAVSDGGNGHVGFRIVQRFFGAEGDAEACQILMYGIGRVWHSSAQVRGEVTEVALRRQCLKRQKVLLLQGLDVIPDLTELLPLNQ